MSIEIVFRIDAWTPSTLPMERLGQYLLELAALYGEASSVHFRGVRKGSAALVSIIDEPAVPKVAERLASARRFDAPAELGETFDRIDRMLAIDNAKGAVRLKGASGNVIVFPGRDRAKAADLGPVRQQGFLDGELVRIGGRDKTVHLQLQDGDILHVNIATDRELARRLGPLIFGPTVRLWGAGIWRRSEAGVWFVDSFRVSRFEVLDPAEDLAAAIEEMRAIPGNDWHLEVDPIAAFLKAQRHTGDRH